jgi:hypothetical protein
LGIDKLSILALKFTIQEATKEASEEHRNKMPKKN